MGPGLVVLSSEVGDAAGGWLALECGVSPVMVVGVLPGPAVTGFGIGMRPVAPLAGIAGLDVSVDRARDGQISSSRLVLINDRRTLATS